jgi:ribonuclease Z
MAAVDDWFISHGHVDHLGAITSLLGIRALTGRTKRPRVFVPAEIAEPLESALATLTTLQRYDLSVELIAMKAGEVHQVRGDLEVETFRTHHTVPSLGYSFYRRINKLRPEFSGLSGPEIARRRKAGEDLFRSKRRHELSYATDTLVQVLDHNPELYKARTLIIECTFLDERKSLQAARAGCHIHLDEILERADNFDNEHLVLMHFSQLYKPSEVKEILKKRCPERLHERIRPLLPKLDRWPG